MSVGRAAPAAAQATSAAAERVLADVRYLAADARQGRGVGTAGLDSAASHVARRLREIGLVPAGSDGYLQPFPLDPTAPAVAHSGVGEATLANVVALLPGRGRLAHQAIVLGAHYDHLGLGGPGSLDPDSAGVVHNGADDNASGTAALLEAARILSRRAAPSHRTLVFVAFTGEELGLLGSEHYVRNPPVPLDSAIAMLNFDMVGRLRRDSLVVIGTGSAAEWPALLDSVNSGHGLILSLLADPWGRSDHSTFYARRRPVLHFFTNTHEDYHRTTDDWEKVNADGIARVAWLAGEVAWALAIRPEPLSFTDVPRPAPVAGGYGAYLGTVPDMTSSPGGVRLTGVRSGSPAERAGLQGGDIVVQIGEYAIGNLYDMTAALRAYKPGDVVRIGYLRDGERHETTATLGRRGG